MLHPLIGGTKWMQEIGPFGPVTVEHSWPHGSESASWEVRTDLTHPALRGGALVQIFDGGLPVWFGYLNEPTAGSGQLEAIGSWREAERLPAVDAAGAPSSVPDVTTVAAGVNYGIRWGVPTSLSAVPWSTAADFSMSVTELLDNWSAGAGKRWYVDPTGLVLASADPTTPTWHVPNAVIGKGLTPAEDEFYSHIRGFYFSATGVVSTVVKGDANAAALFRPRYGTADLTPKGVISAATAQAEVDNMFALSGARMGLAEGLELSTGQITTPGGTPAPLSQVTAGQMARLVGVVDTSRPNLMTSNYDVVIGSSKYTDGSGRITLKPIGYAARNLADVLKVAVDA